MFIKTLLEIQIGNVILETSDADGFSGEIDMDSLYGKLSFELPYQALEDLSFSENNNTETIEKLRLERDMLVRLYYKELEENREVSKDEMDLIFDGRINETPLQKSKTDITYNINCEGTLSFGNNRPPTIDIINAEISKMPNVLLQRGNLQAGVNNTLDSSEQTDLIPEGNVTTYLDYLSGIVAKSTDGDSIIDNIKDFKDRYGLVFIQQLSGELTVASLTGLMFVDRTEAWSFDTNDNIFNIDYGDISSDYDAVIVYGLGGLVGEAIDIVKVQAKGIPRDANGNYKCRIYRVERRDLTSSEDCQKVAREKLLELNKNYLVSFDTKFSPEYKIGQPFVIKDYDIFSGNEVCFIKSLSWTISKTEFSLSITGFINNLSTLPEDLVIGDTGVADVDYLGITNKVSGGDWQNFS